jgi:plastocyanin
MRSIIRFTPRWTAIVMVGLLVGLAVVAGNGRSTQAQTPTPAAPTTLNVGAGFSSGSGYGQAYGPGEFTVLQGGSVKWTINSAEPHSITLGQNPGGGPPPLWPVAGFTAPPPGPPAPVNLGPVDYNGGSQFINSGLLVQGSTATIHFTAAGDYPFICVIHPGMAGTVHVISSGTPTTQAEADQKAQATASFIVSSTKINALRQQEASIATSAMQPNGTTTWTIATGAMSPAEPLPGGGTGFLDLMEFNPTPLNIKAGDTVVWKAADPHTVTFLAAGQTSAALEGQYGGDPTAVPLVKPSDKYDGTSLYTSGLLASGAPGAPASFTLTFPNAGTFQYLCLLHDDLGMKGTVVVGPGSSLPSTGSGPAGNDSSTSRIWWLSGSLAAVALASSLITLGIRRRPR